ncbi:Nuclear pore complex protein Nup214, partial [Pseudolycoriella hygida]
MASEAPSCVEVTDIQFKLNSKYNLIKQEENKNKGNLLAAASVYGLVIIGSSESNLRVVQHSRIIADKDKGVIPSRIIPLPAPPHTIALSCDHSMLAVNIKQNEIPFVVIFSVPSFLSSNIKVIYQGLRLSTDDGITASQLLWNPVLPNTLAVCMSNKSLVVFGFKEQGYDIYSIDKAEQVGCASWSPKGKQIVAGFPNGKIAQYKPDLKIARTIPCTVRLYNTAWDVIAIQWLSTYQFAAVMLSQEEDACPALFIVYAPKNGTPTYINYHDVCYSQSGPRSAQIILNHILPWNLLLVISANGNEVGLLGTKDTGDNPLWKQYTTLDEARAELPLGANKEEMFPLGIDVDTGTTHQIVVNETPLPPMPMLHLLSTHGLLISFNIINTTPNCPTLCSPPQIVGDSSGLNNFILSLPATGPAHVSPPKGDISFGFPTAVTSTPRLPKLNPAPAPNVNEAKMEKPTTAAEPPKSFGNLFGGQTTIQPISSSQSAFSFVPKSTEPTAPTPTSQPSQASAFSISQLPKAQTPAAAISTKPNIVQPTTVEPVPRSENNKPFITVPPSFSQPSQVKTIEKTRPQSTEENTIIDDDIIRKMIREEIQLYETLAKTFLKRCKSVDISIGTKEESQATLKELKELQDISNQATESTDALSSDIQQLKVLLSETYLMIAEVKTKHSLLNES